MKFPSLKFAIPIYFVYFVIGACLLPVLINLAGVDFGSIQVANKIFINNTLEIACVCTALLTVFLSFIDFTIKGDVSTPVVAFALACSAGFDMLHILVSNKLILTSHQLTFITIYTWIFSRTFNALILLSGAGLFLIQSDNLFKNVKKHNRKFLFYVLALLTLITISIILFLVNLSGDSEKLLFSMTLNRSLDIIPLCLYIISLTLIFPKFYSNHPSIFSQTLLVSLIPSIAAQLHVIYGSRVIGDNHYMIATYDKLVSYIIPLIGISLNYLQTHQNEKRVIQALRNESEEKNNLSISLRGILNASINGILVFESVRNHQEKITDFICTMHNAAAEEILTLNKQDHLFSEIFSENKNLLGRFITLVESNAPLSLEVHQKKNNKWFLISAVKLKDGFTKTIVDITENKNAQQEIRNREELLAASEKIAQMGSWERDLVTGQIVWSENLFRIFGLEKKLHEGSMDEADKWLHPEDKEYALQMVNEALHLKKPFEFEYRSYTPQNELKNFIEKGTFVFDDQGEAIKMLGVDLDITARKQAEEQLKKNELLYKTFAANMPDTEVILFNLDYRITLTEGNASNPLFKDKHAMKDAPVKSILDQYQLTSLLNMPGKHEIREVEGRFFKVEFVEIKNEAGEPFAGMILAQDVSELRYAQERLEQKIIDLNKSNRELEQFAYIASHDLQEPLRKITSFGDRLKSKFNVQLPAEAVDYINRMCDASMRMQKLIADLLMFSRLSRSSEPYQPTDLNEVLKNIMNDIDLKIHHLKAKVRINPLPEIEAVSSQMYQLFQNLILNSLKFQKPGSQPEIEITAELKTGSELGIKSKKKYCRIIVSDNGIGFEQKDAERIFNLFQRLNGRSDFEGTGIGLSVCKKIVENHHGMIHADSKQESGATFSLIIPVKHEHHEGN